MKYKAIKIFWKTPCPYCDSAKGFLKSRGIPFEAVDLTDKPEEMARIKSETGWRTVPIIMVDGTLIGGYSDMKELDEKGEFIKMIQDKS